MVNDHVKILDLQTQQELALYSCDFFALRPSGNSGCSQRKMFILFATNSSTTDEGWSASWSTLPFAHKVSRSYRIARGSQILLQARFSLQMSSASKKVPLAELISIDGKVRLSERRETIEEG